MAEWVMHGRSLTLKTLKSPVFSILQEWWQSETQKVTPNDSHTSSLGPGETVGTWFGLKF